MYRLYRLKQLHKVLAEDAAETISVGIIFSHLDYSSTILIGPQKYENSRLQRV